MKSQFSTAWKASRQVRKQRKYQYNAPLHVRHTFSSAPLSKDLRTKYGKRNLPLRKGDEVLVMRGSFAKKKGIVFSVDVKKTRVVIEGINRQKKDGTKVTVYFHPSKLQLQTLNLDDKKRSDILNKSTKEQKNASNKSGNK